MEILNTQSFDDVFMQMSFKVNIVSILRVTGTQAGNSSSMRIITATDPGTTADESVAAKAPGRACTPASMSVLPLRHHNLISSHHHAPRDLLEVTQLPCVVDMWGSCPRVHPTESYCTAFLLLPAAASSIALCSFSSRWSPACCPTRMAGRCAHSCTQESQSSAAIPQHTGETCATQSKRYY
jgi:hypothetical protein